MSQPRQPAGTDPTTPLFTAGEVEVRTGVPATTLRQWERRYGLPCPSRSTGGYRLYSRDDLACVDFLKARIAEGVPPSRAAELYRLDRAAPTPAEPAADPRSAGSTLVPRAPRASSGYVDALVARLVRTLIEGDLDRAGATLSDAYAGLWVQDVLLRVVQPAMVEVGERWHRGEITVAHEHRASSFVCARLHALLDLVGQPRVGPVAVVACAPGERHELGALFVAVFLRRAGVRTHYLGADTPVEDLARFSREVRADAALVSAGGPEAVEALRDGAGRLREAAPLVVLGGPAFREHPSLARELGGHYLGDDAADAVDLLLARLAP